MSDTWPDRLEGVSPSRKADLMMADPPRYWAQARAEARMWAEQYVRDELERRQAERIAAARRTPWWRRWLAVWWASA